MLLRPTSWLLAAGIGMGLLPLDLSCGQDAAPAQVAEEDRAGQPAPPHRDFGGDPNRAGPDGNRPRDPIARFGPNDARPENFNRDRGNGPFPPNPNPNDHRNQPPHDPNSHHGPGPHQPHHGPHDGPGGRSWDDLEQNDPELFKLEKADIELERETFELSNEYRRAPKNKRDEMKKQLDELVDNHFEVRQQRRKLHIKRLEEELQRMREAIDNREELRDQIIGRRVSELTGERFDLDF